jgi:release factor glutamine methyltransferase
MDASSCTRPCARWREEELERDGATQIRRNALAIHSRCVFWSTVTPQLTTTDTGDTEFGPLQLLCRPPTLIPRPETAFMFERFASLVAANVNAGNEYKLLDLYTGSAPIPLLMRSILPGGWRTYGVDASQQAVALAKDNVDLVARQHQDSKPATGIWQADIMSPTFAKAAIQKIGGKCHILTANPPYIPYDQYVNLPSGVREFEDVNALLGDGGPDRPLDERKGDGLSHYRRIAELIPELLVDKEAIADPELKEAPRIALEIGFDQGQVVQDVLRQANVGVSRTECWKDQWDQDRLVVAWL